MNSNMTTGAKLFFAWYDQVVLAALDLDGWEVNALVRAHRNAACTDKGGVADECAERIERRPKP